MRPERVDAEMVWKEKNRMPSNEKPYPQEVNPASSARIATAGFANPAARSSTAPGIISAAAGLMMLFIAALAAGSIFRQIGNFHQFFSPPGNARAAAILPVSTSISVPNAPGADKIVFSTERYDGSADWIVTGISDIFMINADGSNETRLTYDPDSGNDPVLSPDGQKIVFSSYFDRNSDIYVMSTEGGDIVNLTNNADDDICPDWSGDGKMIAFTSYRDGNMEIYRMNADGSNQTRLTHFQADDYCPSWSGDGQKIAFTSNRDGNDEIYMMNADGSDQTRLTNNQGRDSYPDWSPDGQKIVFQSFSGDSNMGIYLMNADGGEIKCLVDHKGDDSSPIWMSGGQKIAFISNRDGNEEIYVMNIDGSDQTRLTKNEIYDIFRTTPFRESKPQQPFLPQQPALPLP
ncbi:MAG: hypothetical protein CVU39_14535 [Chloroflexi bacterium HGW-Chloroflexi-10]|nr:MAG: hypothetical protein CVU39_14535 [Chloroflexi bacterium HGW-Chloroflexi-10]